jgi:hypothetical protein
MADIGGFPNFAAIQADVDSVNANRNQAAFEKAASVVRTPQQRADAEYADTKAKAEEATRAGQVRQSTSDLAGRIMASQQIDKPPARIPFQNGQGDTGPVPNLASQGLSFGTPKVFPTQSEAPAVQPKPRADHLFGYLNDLITTAQKYGKPTLDLVTSADKIIKITESEGAQNGLEALDKGDAAGFEQAFNQSGSTRIKVLGPARPATYDVGEGKYKTYEVDAQHIDANGNPIGSPFTTNAGANIFALNSLQDKIKMAMEESKAKTERMNAEANSVKANADTTRAKAEAAKAGKPDKPAYKVEGGEVATVLGDPAVDAKGRPVLDPLSGRQVVNRNAGKEAEFYRWMAGNGITDTNEGLAKYMSRPQAATPATTRKSGISASDFD